MIIGLTGSLGSGKGTIIEYLDSQGFEYLSTSDEVREEAKRRKIELTRTNLQDLGNELRKQEGSNALAKRVIRKMKPVQNYTVDGIRNPGEVEELKRKNNFFMISVDAPSQLRFTRLTNRNRESDPKNWEEFLKIDNRDKGEGEKSTGQQNAATMELADFHIYNDGDIGAVHEKIKEILEKITDITHEKAMH